MWRATTTTITTTTTTTSTSASMLSQSLSSPSFLARTISTVPTNLSQTFKTNTISNLRSFPSPQLPVVRIPPPNSAAAQFPILPHSCQLLSPSHAHSQSVLARRATGGLWHPRHIPRRQIPPASGPASTSASYYTSNATPPRTTSNNPLLPRSQILPSHLQPPTQLRAFSQSQQQRRDGNYRYRTFEGRGEGYGAEDGVWRG
ncbi:hypothetical protein ACJ73_09965, partial [Blastomyces percursus]